MPDITMCKNKLCPSKNTCYRFTATPDKYLQAWADFKPLNPWEDTCGWYIEDQAQGDAKNSFVVQMSKLPPHEVVVPVWDYFGSKLADAPEEKVIEFFKHFRQRVLDAIKEHKCSDQEEVE